MTWQFWLDVGGTFTDCLARTPDGRLLRRKVLSSGVTKGQAALGSTSERIVDGARTEPDGFWRRYGLQLLDSSGRVVAVATVLGSEVNGSVTTTPLAVPPGKPPLRTDQIAGRCYELISPEEAPILAIRMFLGLALGQPIPPCSMRLGTTRGTNALLTRRGAKTGLVTTRGFADVLRIGYQNRP